MTTPSHPSPVRLARLTGVLYLLIIGLGLFSEVGVRAALVVRGDAAATAANLTASETLWRIGFVADVAVFLADVAVAVLLYVLLRPAGRTLALLAAAFRLVGTAIYGANLLNHLAPVLLLGNADALGALEPAQLQALALHALEVHRHGYDLGLVFFGVHCAMLGALLVRSTAFPSVLGVLMALAGAGYLIGSGTLFLAPPLAPSVAPVYALPLVGELAFAGWLLVRGVRPPA